MPKRPSVKSARSAGRNAPTIVIPAPLANSSNGKAVPSGNKNAHRLFPPRRAKGWL
jgi:hypothetical protein